MLQNKIELHIKNHNLLFSLENYGQLSILKKYIMIGIESINLKDACHRSLFISFEPQIFLNPQSLIYLCIYLLSVLLLKIQAS